MVSAANEMFTRSRKLTTYISDMKGISRQAARFKMMSADTESDIYGLRWTLLDSSCMESAAINGTAVHINMPAL